MKSLFPDSMLNSAELSLEGIASKLVYFSLQFHLVHWQTSGFAEHKATGEAYEYIDGFLDGVIEKLMGYTNRKIGSFKIEPLVSVTSSTLAVDLINFAANLKQFAESNSYNDIANMADELSGEASKIRYLLTLS